MKEQPDTAHLYDVIRAARLIVQFAATTDAETFEQDPLTQSAILHQFLLMGEATKRLSRTFRAAHPDVPWRRMAGMRDRLIHDYDLVDLGLVWQTTVRDVPALLAQIEPLLPA